MNTFTSWKTFATRKTLLQIAILCVLSSTTAVTYSSSNLSQADETLARDTLSKYLKVPTTKLELVDVEAIDWFDASLGCPEPGKFYAQMVVPGFRVVLRVKHQDYNVHLGSKHAVVCELPDGITPPAPSP